MATVPTTPTAQQLEQWNEQGYFIVRNAIARDDALEVRGVIRNHILTPDLESRRDELDPMDPMGDSPEARQARLRKLGNFCSRSPLIWHTIHCNERPLAYARHFLGDDILLKFNSCFLKPARTGSATPWHQDNGLWRDGETEPFNIWIAIDPATRANGCMQFIPRTHQGPVVEHVQYEGSVHAELPRDHVAAMIDKHGLAHIELDPGDMVCWHSSLCHYSPPNTSDQSRIAVAAVYTSPEVVARSKRFKNFQWCMKAGKVCEAFPPEMHVVGDGQTEPAEPPNKAEAGAQTTTGY
ncbi:MAG: phytanoyl-CoA dioxygenase family protein [Phycisphaeraceae bacterium]